MTNSQNIDCEILMIVDDNEVDQFISRKILASLGFGKQHLSFLSSHEAIQFLKSDPLEKLPNIIFLDINMPLLNGYGFLSLFSDLEPEIKNRCKIIILSSSEDRKDIMMMEANEYVVGYLTKPLNGEELMRVFYDKVGPNF